MGPVQGGPQQKIASLHTKTRKKQINDKDYNRHWKVYTHKHITKYNIKKTGVNGVSNQNFGGKDKTSYGIWFHTNGAFT